MATTILYVLSGLLLLIAGWNFIMTWFRFKKFNPNHVYLWDLNCFAGILYVTLSGAFFGRALYDLIEIPFILSVAGSMVMLVASLIITHQLNKWKQAVYEQWIMVGKRVKT